MSNCSFASSGILLAGQPDPNTRPNLKPQILVLNYTPIFVDEIAKFLNFFLKFKFLCVCVCVCNFIINLLKNLGVIHL
jgi:hypothetical protein